MVSPESTDDHPAKRLGRKLREARIAAGYRSQQEFGNAMNLHRTTVTKIESGTRHVTREVLHQWCELCHVDFELYEASARLAWVTDASPVPVWFEDFFRAQVLAHTIRTWHPIIIPGPLQIPDYARALTEGSRARRMTSSTNGSPRGSTSSSRPSSAARCPSPSSQSWMRSCFTARSGRRRSDTEQLMHLAEQGQRRHIGIQVVPAIRAANAGQQARSPSPAWTTPT